MNISIKGEFKMKKLLLLVSLLGMSAFGGVKPYKVLGHVTYNKGNLITTGLEGQQYSTFGITDKVYGKVGVGLEAGAVVSIENKKVDTGYVGPVGSIEVGYKVNDDLNVYGGVNAGLPISFHYKDKTFGIRYDITGRAYVGTEYKGFTAEIGGGYPGYARLGLGYSF